MDRKRGFFTLIIMISPYGGLQWEWSCWKIPNKIGFAYSTSWSLTISPVVEEYCSVGTSKRDLSTWKRQEGVDTSCITREDLVHSLS